MALVNGPYKKSVLYTGFLSSADSNAPGNYALLDIIAALHWIQENIADFKGDRSNVTVMGQGHGAAMVNLLLVSPVLNSKYLLNVSNQTALTEQRWVLLISLRLRYTSYESNPFAVPLPLILLGREII